VDTGELVATFDKHDNTILGLAASKSGDLVASAGGNKRQIYLWKADTGALVKQTSIATPTLSGDGSIPWTAGFSFDGLTIGWGYTAAMGQLFGQGVSGGGGTLARAITPSSSGARGKEDPKKPRRR
jgi:WD40 repeat protein